MEIFLSTSGANQALTFVLSWYEEIDLKALQSLRSDSKWTSDPELIQSRKDTTSFMGSYVQTQYFIPGPVYSDDEEDEEEEDDHTEEDIDEEIEAETPKTGTSTAADATEEIAADRDVTDLLTRSTCRLQHSRQFPSHGLLLFGVWIWWGNSNEPGAT